MTAPLTLPPPAPTPTDLATFEARSDARLAWQDVNVGEMNALLPIIDAAVGEATDAADSAMAAEASAADAAADAIATAADRVQTGLDVVAAAASAASAAALAGAFVGTSTTSLSVGTGTKVFTTQTGELYTVGVTLSAVSAGTPTAFMLGQVNSYIGSTLTLNVTVIGATLGTFSDWNLSLAGVQGPPGPVPALDTPGPIGATTPSSGAFTTLSATGAMTATGNLNCGSQLNFNNAGAVGEIVNRNGTGLDFYVNNAALRAASINASGNLGLGVTPSAWAITGSVVDFQGQGTIGGGSTFTSVGLVQGCNWYYSSGYKYKTTAAAMQYWQTTSGHTWFTAPSGTVGTAITFTQAMTLDLSGNLGVGITPSAWGSTYKSINFRTGSIYDTAGGGTSSGLSFNAYFNGTNWIYNGVGGNATALRYEQGSGGAHRWFTAPSGTGGTTVTFTERMTLTEAGDLSVGGKRVGYLGIPLVAASANTTITKAHAGGGLKHPSSDTSARVFTIDSNANQSWEDGTTSSILNQNAAGVITISVTADTMRLVGTGTTGNRTLAANGFATFTWDATTLTWYIMGSGLT